jgi:hypothetical protein
MISREFCADVQFLSRKWREEIFSTNWPQLVIRWRMTRVADGLLCQPIRVRPNSLYGIRVAPAFVDVWVW